MSLPRSDQQYDPYTIYQNLQHNSYGADRFGEGSVFNSSADAWTALWNQLPPDVQQETRHVYTQLLPQLLKDSKHVGFNPFTSALLRELRAKGVPEVHLKRFMQPYYRKPIPVRMLGWLIGLPALFRPIHR